MGTQKLLDKANAPLQRLRLDRIQLDQLAPDTIVDTQGKEALIYCLTGAVRIASQETFLGTFGGRRSVLEPLVHVLRIPDGARTLLTLSLQGHAADLLYLTCAPTGQTYAYPPTLPYAHTSDVTCHDVGRGCYRREVREVPTPLGYAIHCGETVSDGTEGTWSSWPSHAAPEELARYAEHEEVFFALTSGYFLMREEGQYCTGAVARGVREIGNGEALVTPLGSHELCVSPGDTGIYVWGYVSFLKKLYNKYADESIKRVYVK